MPKRLVRTHRQHVPIPLDAVTVATTSDAEMWEHRGNERTIMSDDKLRKILQNLAQRYEAADDYNRPSIAWYFLKIYSEFKRTRE